MSDSTAYAPVHGGYPGSIGHTDEIEVSEGVAAYVVYPSGKTEHVRIDGQLDTLQRIVGGPIEFVPVPNNPDVHAYCNEDGKFEGLKPNGLATILCGLLGHDEVVGTVIFCGTDEDGNEADLPEEWQNL